MTRRYRDMELLDINNERGDNMKNLKKKKGFTLVECVVAMAVLAIMSLLLTMILTVSMKTRNTNMEIEREIDEQVDKIVGVNKSSEEERDKSIDFEQNKTVIDSIPKNGTDDLEAHKNSFDGDEISLGALNYNFENYTGWGESSTNTVYCSQCKKSYEKDKLLEGGKKCPLGHSLIKEQNIESDKVRGAVDVASVQLVEGTPTDNGDGTKTYKITVRLDPASCSTEKSLKITLPTSVKSINAATKTSNAVGYVIAKNTLRIEPTKADGSFDYEFTFVMTPEDYAKDYVNTKKYFTEVGDSNSATLYRVAGTERFKP